IVEIRRHQVSVLPVVEHTPDGHCLGREHAIREDYYKRSTWTQDTPDLLEDGDGLRNVLDRHGQYHRIERVGIEGQVWVRIDVVHDIGVQIGIVRHLFGIES